MDAMEVRKATTVEISGAFMQTYYGGTVFVNLTGVMVRILLKINPGKYEKCIIWFRGEEVLYFILNKVLYGRLLGEILLCKRLIKFIVEKMGFDINPYDWCVAKKIINLKQYTILWHVEDFKISHEEDLVIINIIMKLSKEFGKGEPLTVNKGLLHEYLGMTVDYRKQGKLQISMLKYIGELLDKAPKYFKVKNVT